jgi:glutamate/tyrosine decarboxylase-like PLP-dependent enzyme
LVRTPEQEPRGTSQGSLDPADWAEFRRIAHTTLDQCIDFLASVRDRPVWRPVPDDVKANFQQPLPMAATTLEQVLEACSTDILPHATGNVHPRFFGWVHGAGTPIGLLAEMIAATMNSNCGGRDHGAIYVERQVIAWCREIFGFPEESSGVLTVGTSMASVIAIAAARTRALTAQGQQEANGRDSRLVGYCSSEVHVALKKAFKLLGLGATRLHAIPADAHFALPVEQLAAAISVDRAAGLNPFLVIGTAGTVNTGGFDNLDALADLAAREHLWFHVDGAFGAWARIADCPWKDLVRGIERADSLAFDFHKWMSVPYDAGCVLMRDEKIHRATFADRPDYLAAGARGLAGGDPWPSDYGIDLSRGFRALKVWMTLRHYGLDQLGRMITKNCASALQLAGMIETSDRFELAAPVSLNICCFRLRQRGSAEADDRLIARLVEELQIGGIAAPSTTRIKDRLCVRVAILNHRTDREDLDLLVKSAEAYVHRL